MQVTYGIVKMFCSVCAVVSPGPQNGMLCQSSPTEPYPQEKLYLRSSKVIWKENDLITKSKPIFDRKFQNYGFN